MEQGQTSSVRKLPSADFAAVCHSVRAALETARVQAVSLHDEKGDILWLTESSMGPDEHNAVQTAFEAFANAAGPGLFETDLGDARSAVLFRAVNHRRSLVGAIMIIVESRALRRSQGGAARLMNAGLQRALTQFAAMRPDPGPVKLPSPPVRAPSTAPIELSLADSMRSRSLPEPLEPRRPAAPVAALAAAPGAAPAAATGAGASPKTTSAAVPPQIDRLNSALRRIPIGLHVQRLVPLSRGSELTRYEVLLRARGADAPNGAPMAMLKAAVDHGLGSMIDRRVITELIGWLVRHPDIWRNRESMFSVNLTRTAVLDEHFIKFVGLCLSKAALPKGTIGFELDVETAIALGDQASVLAASLNVLGCPLVLDDFGLRTECFDLLRLPGVRYVKLDSEITRRMRSDKLCQAAITAVVQMARVLGMHTVAKRTESAAEREWLTALGVDFVQSNALAPAVPLDSIGKPKTPGS